MPEDLKDDAKIISGSEMQEIWLQPDRSSPAFNANENPVMMHIDIARDVEVSWA